MVGGGGTRTIILEATAPGKDSIQLAYVQPWRFSGFDNNPEQGAFIYYEIKIEVIQE